MKEMIISSRTVMIRLKVKRGPFFTKANALLNSVET